MREFCKLAMLSVVLSCTACSTIKPVQPVTGPTVEVLVEGIPSTLTAFDQALQPTIQGFVVGCVHCDQLATAQTLTYSFFRHQTELYEKFGTAWNAVPASPPTKKPKMTFFESTAISPDCTSKPACYNLWPCLQFAHCTKDATLRSCTGPC